MPPAAMKGLLNSGFRKASSTGVLLVFLGGGGKWLVNAMSLSPEWIGTVGLPYSSSRYPVLLL